MSKSIPRHTSVYEISVCPQIKILSNFILREEFLYTYKLWTEILNHVGNYNKLQEVLRLSHLASLLGNNYNFFLSIKGLLLGDL